MNEEQIQKKYKQAKVLQMDIEENLQLTIGLADRIKVAIAALEAQIAEAEKPEFRNWEIGGDGSQEWIKVDAVFYWIDGKDKLNTASCLDELAFVNDPHINIHDVLADLKALSEQLKELHYGHIACEIRQHDLVLKIGATTHCVIAQDVSQFILDLRRLVHTAEQARNA